MDTRCHTPTRYDSADPTFSCSESRTLTTRTTYHVMYEGSPVRDTLLILVNWSGLSKSSDYLPNMSVLQHAATVAEAYHTVIKGVPQLN